jgi:hypothetical protein
MICGKKAVEPMRSLMGRLMSRRCMGWCRVLFRTTVRMRQRLQNKMTR